MTNKETESLCLALAVFSDFFFLVFPFRNGEIIVVCGWITAPF